MRNADEHVLDVASIVREAADMNDAALARDFDEARFRAQLIVGKADALGLVDVVLAAGHLIEVLGPIGSKPKDGYGAGMLRIANELGKVGFEPL